MKAVILISGNGSNLQSIIDNADKIDLQIRCVISDNKNAFGLVRAKSSKIQTYTINPELFSSRRDFDKELISIIDPYEVELIILAGYMRILSSIFVSKYFGMILNIHPSLLPKFPGLNTHQRVLNSSDTIHGTSVHFVVDKLDSGPIVAQDYVNIDHLDSAKTLSTKVLSKEHALYPKIIHWYTQGRLKLINNESATLDGRII